MHAHTDLPRVSLVLSLAGSLVIRLHDVVELMVVVLSCTNPHIIIIVPSGLAREVSTVSKDWPLDFCFLCLARRAFPMVQPFGL
jgi:hypothetical protein